MRAICQEFERQEREGGEEAPGAKESNDRIFQLMQQVFLKLYSVYTNYVISL